jgi:RNA polymerase sigma-70 factor (ECF subfamily)
MRPEAEARIAELLDAGDREGAAATAVRELGQPVLLYLMKLVADRDVAQELFARACEKLWKGIGEFRRESSMSTWFHKIAWNAARDYRREARHRRERRLASDELVKITDAVRTSTLRFLKSDVRDKFAKIRDQLDPEDRSLLVLRVERDLKWKDIAIVMSERGRAVDERALRKRFERLMIRLRKLARDEGLIPAS